MVECITIPIEFLHKNDYDVFDATPFIKKRYKQMLEDGFIFEPLHARKIKTFDTDQHYKLLDANYKLSAMKSLRYKEIAIIVNPIMAEDIAADYTLRLAENKEIVNKNNVENTITEIHGKYDEKMLRERLGIEELLPEEIAIDIPEYELSEEELNSIDIKIDNSDIYCIECPVCGHKHSS